VCRRESSVWYTIPPVRFMPQKLSPSTTLLRTPLLLLSRCCTREGMQGMQPPAPLDGIYGIICIKDTYVVCKYVKKTLLKLVFKTVLHLEGLHMPAAHRRQTPVQGRMYMTMRCVYMASAKTEQRAMASSSYVV
jgi:hypothetical protein